MAKKDTSLIILAAGQGKRMVSSRPKCLHPVGGFPMIDHVLKALSPLANQVIVVVADAHDPLAHHLSHNHRHIKLVVQERRLGTGDAVKLAMKAVRSENSSVMIAYGDTPLLTAEAFKEAAAMTHEKTDLVIAGFYSDSPQGYGRLIIKQNRLMTIVEEKDASEAQKAITLCNSGFMVGKKSVFETCLPKLKPTNEQQEYYLTDLVHLAQASSMDVGYLVINEIEAMGINTRADLARVEKAFQNQKRHAMMMSGVTLRDPESVFFALDTDIGTDSLIEPHVIFGPGVKLGRHSTIKGLSHLEGVTADDGVQIGPFARLRPGSQLSRNVSVGNFVETKSVHLGEGVKAGHLAYLGDGIIGEDSNIGAGTIFCNYDGVNKHQTILEKAVFVGSNSALVAPVNIGQGAYIGSGSVITHDVPAGDLALGRGKQVNLHNRAPKKSTTE